MVQALTPGGNGNWAQMEIEDWDIFDELVIRPKRGYFSEALSGSTTWNLEGITVPTHVSLLVKGFFFVFLWYSLYI